MQSGSTADKNSKKNNGSPADHGGIVGSSEWLWLEESDAEFIATSRTIIPELVVEFEKLQKENQDLRLDLITAYGQKDGGYE